MIHKFTALVMEYLKFIFFVALAVCFGFVYRAQALKCLKCFSYTSWSDCRSKMGLVTCSEVYDRCTNTTVEVYVKTMDESLIGYELGCGKEEECQQKRCPRHFGIDIPGSQKYKNCQISCCSGDLCPLPPNSTIRPPKAGPDKGARGGVGRVTLWPWYSFGQLLLWTVFSKLFGVV